MEMRGDRAGDVDPFGDGAEALRAALDTATDDQLRDKLIADTISAVTILEILRDPPQVPLARRVRRLFPELVALTTQADPLSSIEHEHPTSGATAMPLLDHLSVRVLRRKLWGLERGKRAIFQRDEALHEEGFYDEVERLDRVRRRGVLPIVRAALIHLDFAKGGTREQREIWRGQFGADLTVHNRAARQILEQATSPGADRAGVLRGLGELGRQRALEELTLALIESHGLAGQAVRGETPLACFAPWVAYLRLGAPHLAEYLDVPVEDARSIALDCFHLVNVCDTAGVREGLLTDELRTKLLEVSITMGEVARAQEGHPSLAVSTAQQQLEAFEERQWRERLPNATPSERGRAYLADRLSRLRRGRQLRGEPSAATAASVGSLDDDDAAAFGAMFRRCQLWYAEAGSAALSPEGQLKILALAMRAAQELPRAGAGGPFHVSLLPLLRALSDPDDRSVPNRVRLIETMLAPLSLRELLGGSNGPSEREHPLGTFATEMGGADAVELHFRESREAAALLTLLPIYEAESSAAFHTILKALCDVYGLRKDEFDRVANEGLYLSTMNSARSDKERMLDFVRPGRIVEVGPGGGVVLDLLEQRFDSSEIIGLDSSRMVVEALHQRRTQQHHRWQVVEGDAFELSEVVGEGTVDTVIFCSVLHEIYSYVERPDERGVVGRFRLESVRDLLRAAFRTLIEGGRLVIRDGVMPTPATHVLQFLVPDAREFFDLFCQEFAGRRIVAEPLGDDRVRLSSADAMEFLYTYTWGPESFPYEVREQYGVLPYIEYRDAILAWLSDLGDPAWIPLPEDQASYLQDGYRRGLAGKVALFDEHGQPTSLPDSNCLLIIEKRAATS